MLESSPSANPALVPHRCPQIRRGFFLRIVLPFPARAALCADLSTRISCPRRRRKFLGVYPPFRNIRSRYLPACRKRLSSEEALRVQVLFQIPRPVIR